MEKLMLSSGKSKSLMERVLQWLVHHRAVDFDNKIHNREMWLIAGVNVYSNRPRRFIISRDVISDVSIKNNLCFHLFSGIVAVL